VQRRHVPKTGTKRRHPALSDGGATRTRYAANLDYRISVRLQGYLEAASKPNGQAGRTYHRTRQHARNAWATAGQQAPSGATWRRGRQAHGQHWPNGLPRTRRLPHNQAPSPEPGLPGTSAFPGNLDPSPSSDAETRPVPPLWRGSGAVGGRRAEQGTALAIGRLLTSGVCLAQCDADRLAMRRPLLVRLAWLTVAVPSALPRPAPVRRLASIAGRRPQSWLSRSS
jgi:hypothetical protein